MQAKRSKASLRGFSVGVIIGLLFMATAAYSLQIIQTKTITNTVAGKAPNLVVSPSNIDWARLANHEVAQRNVTLTNNGDDVAWVYWTTDVCSDYALTAAIGASVWNLGDAYPIKLNIAEAVQVTFTLERVGADPSTRTFNIVFKSVML